MVAVEVADAMRVLPPVATTADWPTLWRSTGVSYAVDDCDKPNKRAKWIHHKSEKETGNGPPFHSRKFMKL